jgi:DNA-binding MarR family transcriptional regulator
LGTLQRKKFIVPRRSGKDGRALSVSLTEKGRVMTERIIPIASHYEEVATRGMKQTDLERLKKMLVKLFSNMHVFDKEFAVRQKGKTRMKFERRR